jgi:Rrf2 family protein
VQSREIAQRQKVPEAYLHQVLSALNKSGLVRSTRGPTGGHELARPPDQITLLDAMMILDGIDSNAHPHLPDNQCDPIHDFWHELLQQSILFLAGITLQDLIERLQNQTPVANYSI